MPLREFGSYSLPETATAPFCPSEVRGSVEISETLSSFKKFLKFVGPGLMIAVGYMDPGNWATDIEAGSRFGYDLIFVVLLSSMAAMALQCLCVRLGIVSGRDLAQLSRDNFKPWINRGLWVLAEISIIACDLAEVLGSALAFHLILGCSLPVGILITALDTVLILGLQGKGFRRIEAIIIGLIATIGLCYFVELFLLKPYWPSVARGLVPSWQAISSEQGLYIAIGILGATVMPHNLYLHTSIVQTRISGESIKAKKQALTFSTLDTLMSLTLAFFVNAAILILAGCAFYLTGHNQVAEIEEAYHLLDPVMGTGAASLLFAVALLASGQSSTFTGTIAGQVIMEGHLKLKIPCWKRRVITRALALGPALFGVWWLGSHAIGKMLVMSQVVLSLQLPFAMAPLILFAGRKSLMGELVIPAWAKLGSWLLFAIITTANVWLIFKLF